MALGLFQPALEKVKLAEERMGAIILRMYANSFLELVNCLRMPPLGPKALAEVDLGPVVFGVERHGLSEMLHGLGEVLPGQENSKVVVGKIVIRSDFQGVLPEAEIVLPVGDLN